MPRAYKNPTEDTAIGNVMREERMKKRIADLSAKRQPGKRSRERQRENRRRKHLMEG